MAGGHRAGPGRGSVGFWGVTAPPSSPQEAVVNGLTLICCSWCEKGRWEAASVPQEVTGCIGWGVRGKGPPKCALGRCGEVSTASPAPGRAASKPWGVHTGLSSAQLCAVLLSVGGCPLGVGLRAPPAPQEAVSEVSLGSPIQKKSIRGTTVHSFTQSAARSKNVPAW